MKKASHRCSAFFCEDFEAAEPASDYRALGVVICGSIVERIRGLAAAISCVGESLMVPSDLENFVYDEALAWYEGSLAVGPDEILLYLAAETDAQATAVLSQAEAFLVSIEGMLSAAKDYAAEKLLDLRNEGWGEDGSPELSKDEFISNLVCFSILLYPTQNVEIIFRAGDLFSGHVVLISANMQGHFSDASIAG